tara:strand:+ start:598 stop:1092 length:495 start_codon:yes stop_codon:yes gene_type:complete
MTHFTGSDFDHSVLRRYYEEACSFSSSHTSSMVDYQISSYETVSSYIRSDFREEAQLIMAGMHLEAMFHSVVGQHDPLEKCLYLFGDDKYDQTLLARIRHFTDWLNEKCLEDDHIYIEKYKTHQQEVLDKLKEINIFDLIYEDQDKNISDYQENNYRAGPEYAQ